MWKGFPWAFWMSSAPLFQPRARTRAGCGQWPPYVTRRCLIDSHRHLHDTQVIKQGQEWPMYLFQETAFLSKIADFCAKALRLCDQRVFCRTLSPENALWTKPGSGHQSCLSPSPTVCGKDKVDELYRKQLGPPSWDFRQLASLSTRVQSPLDLLRRCELKKVFPITLGGWHPQPPGWCCSWHFLNPLWIASSLFCSAMT